VIVKGEKATSAHPSTQSWFEVDSEERSNMLMYRLSQVCMIRIVQDATLLTSQERTS